VQTCGYPCGDVFCEFIDSVDKVGVTMKLTMLEGFFDLSVRAPVLFWVK
jgi:hypothetical protein